MKNKKLEDFFKKMSNEKLDRIYSTLAYSYKGVKPSEDMKLIEGIMEERIDKFDSKNK